MPIRYLTKCHRMDNLTLPDFAIFLNVTYAFVVDTLPTSALFAEKTSFAHQYNTKHGDKPIAPIRSWTSTAPPTARFDPNKKPYVKPPASNSQPYKPTIKYFLADSNGDPVQIDPAHITTIETDTSDPAEDEFHETQQEIPSPSIGIKPTINQMNTNIMPLFPDYAD
eukprot:scaffold45134_cov49-Attheya_sp.AAC.1